MATINDDILKFANQSGLKILANDKVVKLRHKFRISDKSTLGILFFLFGGIFLLVVSFIKTLDTDSKIIGITLGISLLVLSTLTIIRQITDGLEIKDNILTFRHNLKQRIIPLNSRMKIKMKTEIIKIARVGALGSEFIIISHFIQDQNKEIPVFKFQMDKSYTEKAMKLGNELTRIINDKIRQ